MILGIPVSGMVLIEADSLAAKIVSVFLGVLVPTVIVALGVIGVPLNTGFGSQVGYVSATETEGILFKTHRAYIKPTMESTQEDIYCVVDEQAYQDLVSAQSSNAKVEIQHYSLLSAGIKNCKGESAIIKEMIIK